MRKQILLLGRECAAFFCAAVFLVIMVSAIFIDVDGLNDTLSEFSLTEILQELMLAAMVGIFAYLARHDKPRRGAFALIGGFYACMLIRELDFLFDGISFGSWIWFALAAAAGSLLLALRHPQNTLNGLVHFVSARSWPMTASGLLTVLVFSRLFGMHQLWQHLLDADYIRTVKNMVEEGTELLGYSLCWLASLHYLRQSRRENAAVSPAPSVSVFSSESRQS